MAEDFHMFALALVFAVVGVIVAAIGALVGMEVATAFGLSADVCMPLGAATALLVMIMLERRETRASRSKKKR